LNYLILGEAFSKASESGVIFKGMSKPLTKDEIFKKLMNRYKEKDSKILKEVAYNLCLASTTEASLEERASRALNRIQATPRPQEPLKQMAAKQHQNKLSVCGICKMPMKTVKLLEDRSAYYCPDHRVTVPFPKDEE
jgi:adenylate kinase family enzyme